jgi:dTDP-4-dehydrorhamnose reductase
VTRSSAPPTLLVTGGTGQLGHELVRELAPLGRVVAPPRAELDLRRPDAVRSYVRALRPEVIVNAAAYTAVDDAETDGDACHAVNAAAPGALAEEAASLGSVLVHFSTDYVFDGMRDVPYAEDDEPRPLQVYGQSKLFGERGVLAAGGIHLILRTSWVYGVRGRNFLRTVLRLAREPRALRVVDDQVGAPTWCRLVAAATAQLLAPYRGGLVGARVAEAPGVYHLTGAGRCSWAEFAEAVLSLDPSPDEHRCGGVRRVSSAEYAARAPRPRCSLLDNRKVHDQFGVVMPHWRSQLQLALEQ